ncbi:hypothetical protein GCM10009809_19480 [Isoptericola hypogeus]|uniref:Lipoprotein n=1 Tax=Isoptericola hypogeus TaxID=300179 RepID=A0ABN2JDY4_9MICO
MTHHTITTPASIPVTTTRDRRYRALGALALAAGVAVTTTACAGISEALSERNAGHTKAFTYDSGRSGKNAEVLPAWVPDDAADVRGVFRTTGDEVILLMDADVADLPVTCQAVDDAHPLATAPARDGVKAEDVRDASTLKAGWWTAGQEQDATFVCDGWWVGEADGALFAFTPELTAVEIEEQPDPA